MNNLPQLQPRDGHNLELERQVRPPDWVNPEPAGRYNLVVIGAGTAGLVCAAGAAGLGAKVALVERALMGGDCLNVGCVPSKAILRSSRAVDAVRGAGSFGVGCQGEIGTDFGAVMERMRRLRAAISPHDSAARFRELGVDVFLGQGIFLDGETIAVEGRRLKFHKAVIATGARAAVPSIPGMDGVAPLTNEAIFSLTELPRRLGVIGAGPIGCEMAQAFARFGSEVYLVETLHGVLPKEDPEAAHWVRESLQRDGVHLLCCGRDLKLAPAEGGTVRLRVESHGRTYDQEVDKLLVAVGRSPNVEDLGLEQAGVEYDARGVKVNDRLQTSHPSIYAAGDVCSPFQFTHAADFMARIVIQNALFMGRARFSALHIPWCTYTTPELAHVGLTAAEAARRNLAIDTFTQPMSGVDRAILDGETDGFVRVHVRKGRDEIVGGTIVAARAGDMISEIVLAMTHGIGLKKLAAVIHPYPTHHEAVRKVGDLYNRTRLTPLVKAAMKRWMAWRR